MYRAAERNWDRATLEGDHSTPRSHGGHVADRLLHSTCNRSRGDGSNDAQRPAVTGRDPEPHKPNERADLGTLAMRWPR